MNDTELIRKEKLIVILRKIPEIKLKKTLSALYQGGVRIIETAFNPSDDDTVKKTPPS